MDLRLAKPRPTHKRAFALLIVLLMGLLSVSSALVGKSMLNLGNLHVTQSLLTAYSPAQEEPRCADVLSSPSHDVLRGTHEAALNLGTALRYDSRSSASLGLGLVYMVLGDFQKAANVLRESSTKRQEDPRVYFLLGCTYMHAGNLEIATSEWQHVPDFAVWYYQRGFALSLARDWDASLQEYYSAAKIEPSSFLYHHIAYDYTQLGLIDQAIQAYQRAIALAQTEKGVYTPDLSRLEMAKLLLAQKQWDRAKAELEKVISDSPSISEAYETLGVVYYQGYNDFRKANDLLIHAIELNPAAARPYMWAGKFNRDQGSYAEAERWLKAGLSLPLNDWAPWIHGELGRVYLEEGRYTEAIPELEAVINAVPTDVWFLELTGDAYLKAGNAQKASERYQEVLNLDPLNTRVLQKQDDADADR